MKEEFGVKEEEKRTGGREGGEGKCGLEGKGKDRRRRR